VSGTPGRRFTSLTAGVHPRVAQELLGHSTVGITLGTCSHVAEGMEADAAALVAGMMTISVLIRHQLRAKSVSRSGHMRHAESTDLGKWSVRGHLHTNHTPAARRPHLRERG
jgi:hypothetical protein